MHLPRHCSSPYTSDNDSDTPSSTSSGDDDNDDNETRTQRPTQSLGRMLPLQAHQLTPEFNAVRHHTVVVRSRDRSLWNEHLFQLGVSFGDVATQLSQTEQLQRARLQTCYDVSDVPSGVPSSVQTGIAQLQSCPQPYTGVIMGVNDGLGCSNGAPNVFNTPRRCVVHRVYRNVVGFALPHLILPFYPQMRFTPDPSDVTDPSLVRTMALTPDVFVEMQPSPHAEQLAGTDAVVRNSTFVLAPSDNSDAHVHYSSINAEHEPLDTPVNYLNHLRLTLHTPDECLRTQPFVPSASPDVYRVTCITYTVTGAGGGEMAFTLNEPVPMVHYLWTGATSTPQHALHVSLRDVQLDTSGGGSYTVAQSGLYAYLCGVFSARCWVTQTYDAGSPLCVTVPMDAADAPPPSVVSGTKLATAHTGTALLNESMQYTMVFHVATRVRRLRMSVQ